MTHPQYTNLIGVTFNKLTIVSVYTTDKYIRCLCKCSCGGTTDVILTNLQRSQVQSCGCLNGEFHGMSHTKIYKIWKGMKDRCYNINTPAYKNYGGRGITMCSRWQLFSNFYEDMGERPENKTLDRINNNLGYSPTNCKWSTYAEQANNRQSTIHILYKGEIKSISQFAIEYGLKPSTVISRIRKGGWSYHDALTTPIRKSRI